MPRRNDIHRVLLIGAGPIVIGQACEFDYSGVQGLSRPCKRGGAAEVVLVNSNPATVMTDVRLVRGPELCRTLDGRRAIGHCGSSNANDPTR